MANYEALTSAIQQAIKTNGNQEITGQVLQTVLLQMVNALGTGAQFMGEATLTTDPGNPDASVFYIASIKGTYTHFGNLVLNTDEVAALSNATGAWTKTTLFYLQSGAPGWDTTKDPTEPLLAAIKAGHKALGVAFWDNFISNSPLKTISSGKLGIASGLSDGNITIYLASNIPVAVTATYAYRGGGDSVSVTIPANGTARMVISGTAAGASDNLNFSFDYDIEEDHRCIAAVAMLPKFDAVTFTANATDTVFLAARDGFDTTPTVTDKTVTLAFNNVRGWTGDDYMVEQDSKIEYAIPAATETQAGVMTAADKSKLDGAHNVLSIDITGTEIPTVEDSQVQVQVKTDMTADEVLAVFRNQMVQFVTDLEVYHTFHSSASNEGLAQVQFLRFTGTQLIVYDGVANVGTGQTAGASFVITISVGKIIS